MTILQLKYVLSVASSTSMRVAANKLFVSQPALSMAISELEKELNIQIFKRTSKGINLTDEGREFLVFAKQTVNQYKLIEEKYLTDIKEKKFFSVSMQHYIFAIHAFSKVVKEFDHDNFSYSIYETRTDAVIDNVKNLKSEVGVVSFTGSNEQLMRKLLRENGLDFYPLFVRDAHVYMWGEHPLAGKAELSLEELREYPCISFEQDNLAEYYLAEEPLAEYNFVKRIRTNDRATSVELIIDLNGYSIGTGAMMESLALKSGFVSIRLKEKDPLTIGYIIRKDHELSEMGEAYVNELLKHREAG